jgi:Fe2+ or Zn2+ uptake regulation protein
MAEAGELLNIGSIRGAAHYDHNCHSQYHFICDKCGRVFDIDDFFPEIQERVPNKDGFQIKGHSLIFNGLCPECG